MVDQPMAKNAARTELYLFVNCNSLSKILERFKIQVSLTRETYFIGKIWGEDLEMSKG